MRNRLGANGLGKARPVTPRMLRRMHGQNARENRRIEEEARKKAEEAFQLSAQQAGFTAEQLDWLLQHFARKEHKHL